MTNARSIQGILVLIFGILIAVWLGLSIVTNQSETLVQVLSAIVLLTCVFLGRRVWMIVPFLGALGMTLMISGMPTTLLVGQALFLGFALLLILMRKLPMRFQFTEIEFWILMITLFIVQVYVRNPVGLNILGGGSVGGRPYVLFGITLVCCVMFGSLLLQERDLKWIYRLTVIGWLLNFTFSCLGFFVPQVGVWMGTSNAVRSTSGEYAMLEGASYSRIGFLGQAARNLSLYISSRISPLKACFHPGWSLLVLISIAFAGLSGFRNEMAMLGLTYLVGLVYRGGGFSLLVACFGGMILLILISLLNIAVPLPDNIQRAMSFLPGTWNERVKQDAGNSTDWRIEMWKEALLTDYWIKNKILGDGLGFTQREFEWMKSLNAATIGGAIGSGKLTMQQQHMMVTCSYHSGPVSAVRVVGYAGLFIFLLAQIRLAVHAHRQILRCRNTEWYPLALVLGIRTIWAPAFFVFVFGDFPLDVSAFLMNAAMVRLLETNLPLPAYVKPSRLPYLLQAPRPHMTQGTVAG